jgi:catechol 2,3-dioxygenase-like lactoylglutathione lyase family enzyme
LDIDNVGICVTDLGRSIEFYQQLGLEPVAKNDRGVTMAAGTGKVFVFQSRGGGPVAKRELGLFGNPPGIDHIAFRVDDVDAFYRTLTRRRIQAGREPADQEWGARAFGLRDPDGNNLYFLRWL